MFAGEEARLQREHNDRAWLAWHVARLSMVNPKKFPKIEKLMVRGRGKRRAAKQTPEQMLAVVKMLNAAYGGSIVNETEH